METLLWNLPKSFKNITETQYAVLFETVYETLCNCYHIYVT